jgi:hypothetical protein
LLKSSLFYCSPTITTIAAFALLGERISLLVCQIGILEGSWIVEGIQAQLPELRSKSRLP